MDAMNNNLVIERKFRPIRVLKLRNISPVPQATRLREIDSLLYSPPGLCRFFSLFRLSPPSPSSRRAYALWPPATDEPTSQPTNLPSLRALPPSHVRIMAIQIANRFISPGAFGYLEPFSPSLSLSLHPSSLPLLHLVNLERIFPRPPRLRLEESSREFFLSNGNLFEISSKRRRLPTPKVDQESLVLIKAQSGTSCAKTQVVGKRGHKLKRDREEGERSSLPCSGIRCIGEASCSICRGSRNKTSGPSLRDRWPR